MLPGGGRAEVTAPLVSVIMPLYNKRPWVRRALDSIASQTLNDFEVIVIDDGSTDGSGDIAADYPDQRFRLIRQANAGPGAARNRGLAECRGQFVAFLDADDEWLPGYLQTSIQAMERLGPDVATHTCSYFYGSSGDSSESMWRDRGISNGAVRATPNMDPKLFVYWLAFMHLCTTVARTDVLRRWGGFYAEGNCRYAEDAFLLIKVLLNERVGFQLPANVRIHHDAGSLSQNLSGAHPIEPFLEKPELLKSACPPELKPLLQKVLALRAFKTACVLGYWGQWQEAAELRQRFQLKGAHRLPYFWRSLILTTKLGAAAGPLWRNLSGRADPPVR